MALYFFAVTTLSHEEIERRFPDVNVQLSGSALESALTDPVRLLWLLFRHVNGWAHSPWRHELAANLSDRADLFADAAHAVATAPAARWWWQPLDRDSQTWYQAVDAQEPPLPHDFDLEPDPLSPTLPAWGMFTSTRIGSLPGGYLCGWDGSPEPLSIWQVPIHDDARIFSVRRPDDWRALVQRYPRGAGHGGEAPDWWLVSDDWDGVHLTVAGYLTVPECIDWLHESTVWLRSAFGPVTRLPDWPYREVFTAYDWPTPPWP